MRLRLPLRLSWRRLRLSRREKLVLGGLALAAVLGAIAFGPLVRAEVSAEAARRHLRVQVGGVRPGWFAVRLLDVVARPEGADSIRLRVDEARVGLTIGFHVDRVELRGGGVDLDGSADRIRDDWARWRADRPPTAGGGRTLPIVVETMALRWTEGEGRELRAEAHDLAARRDSNGTHVQVGDAAFRTGRGAVSLTDAQADIDSKGTLIRAHATAMTLELSPRPEPRVESVANDASSSSPPPLQVARTTRDRPRGSSPPPPPVDPGAPLIALPDVRAARARAGAVAGLLADRVPEGAGLSVDALTWKIAEGPDRVALTMGPGPLTLTRTASRFELRFSTDQQAPTTSLSVLALLPTDSSDVSVTLEGGPVSLSVLGIREGAAGLVDVERATVTGRARVVLAGDGSALTFDAEGGARGLAIHQPRLAADVVRGIDVGLRARGALSAGGEVRLDDFGATFGALHLGGSGVLDQEPDHVSASFRFELPSTACQSLLDSVPTALLPALQGTRIAGTFGARGRFAFDTRALDDLELDYDLQDRCRMVEVPDSLARERFKDAFEHRIYLPDGTTTDQTTGPGTENWTALEEVSPYMQVAVMTTEDGAFPKHHGFNRAAIRSSIIANLKARRFVRGASTITMQLAKNLFLSRDKTLARKLEEVVLTDYLEQVFSKDELMELYLNVIEFGPAVYGITQAAEYYFGRTPAELDLAECLFLSSLLPAPLRYGAMREREQAPDGWLHTLRALMEVAHKRGLITDAELAEGLNEPIIFWHGGERPPPRPAAQARGHLDGSDDVDQPAIDMPSDAP